MGEEDEKIHMKLIDSDYENIFFRIREKLLIQLIAVIALLLAIAGYSTWIAAKTEIVQITSTSVDKYVQSKEFQDTVISEYQGRLSALEKRSEALTTEIEKKEIAIAKMSSIPIYVDGSDLMVTSPSGQTYKIQTGFSKSGESVLFKQKYLSEPLVIAVIDGQNLDAVDLARLDKTAIEAFAIKATVDGFNVPDMLRHSNYRWMAIGQ